MTGIILCGGQSSRMGSDKGLLHHPGGNWAQVAANKLSALNIPVALSVNEIQQSLYLKVIKNYTLLKDNSSLQIGGPLKGILSAHINQPEEDLFVLACDIRDMHTEPLNLLISESASDNEAIVYGYEKTIEPLCGVYTSKGLKKIYNSYLKGRLKNNSMHYVLGRLDARYLTLPEEWKKYFKNYNSPEDSSSL